MNSATKMGSSDESILIIGAGVIGSSVADHLSHQLPGARIEVLDLDLEGEWSSSELNAGGVRATWSQPVNVDLSIATIDFFRDHAEEVGYRDVGYLWLCNEKQLEARSILSDLHRSRGWPVEIWNTDTLRERVPFIDKVSDLAGATFGPRDGLVNPNLVKKLYRKRATQRGVIFRDRCWITGFTKKSGTQTEIEGVEFDQVLPSATKRGIFENPKRRDFQDIGHKKIFLNAGIVINCAGPWAGAVAQLMGYSRPSKPLRRQLSLFESREVDFTPYGMIIDSSGAYFHPESIYGLSGFAVPHETPGYRFDYDGELFFQEYVWAPLFERATCFERLRHVSGWGGLYEVSPDHSAILGPVKNATNVGRAFEAHSFSGHGVMQSYSAGLALADWIVNGKCARWEVDKLSGDRFEKNELVSEGAII